jgi:hypothetical protein
MWGSVLFLWRATRGSRLRPWRSPYLRWRFETYTGKRAETVTAKDFVGLATKEWRQILHFLRWTGEMHEYANESRK